MAKQKGIVKLDGTIGDITFFKSADGYIAREATSVTGKRIASDPAFQRTRENMAEFGRAGKAGKTLRAAIRPLMLNAQDAKVTSRLHKEMVKVLKADMTSKRGLRNVIDGEATLLQGFEFNINAILGTSLTMKYDAAIDRVAGTGTINVPAFIPSTEVVVPMGTTHFKLVTAAAEIDFEAATSVVSMKQTDYLPWNDVSVVAFSLVNNVTANSKHPIFLLLGIQFSQEVAGLQNPLKDGSFNSLSVVKVDGGV